MDNKIDNKMQNTFVLVDGVAWGEHMIRAMREENVGLKARLAEQLAVVQLNREAFEGLECRVAALEAARSQDEDYAREQAERS